MDILTITSSEAAANVAAITGQCHTGFQCEGFTGYVNDDGSMNCSTVSAFSGWGIGNNLYTVENGKITCTYYH